MSIVIRKTGECRFTQDSSLDKILRSGENVNVDQNKIDELAKILNKQIDGKAFERKYAPAKDVLKLVGAGAFVAASLLMPGLPLVLKPFLDDARRNEREVWKRFNIPYLKRTLQRLEEQKLVEYGEENGMQVIKITNQGRQRVIRMALDDLEIKKPKVWDRRWRLVSFDLPEKMANTRKVLVKYLSAWKFYPLHKSVYLHAYPCLKEVGFLREYLGVGEYVRTFTIIVIENDRQFRSFFGV